MDCRIVISSNELDDKVVQGLTRDLVSSINKETDMEAALPEQEAQAGERGDPVSVGMLAITFLTSGSAAALFQVLKSFFERDKSLELCIKKNDGQEVIIKAENVSSSQIKESIEAVKFFCGEQR